jgi:hypothetical protein
VKVGCIGCFLLTLAVLTCLVVVGGVLFLSANIFGAPDVRPVSFSKGDGYAAQQKLYEVVQRQSKRSSRRDAITLNEREANAFLSRHLEMAGIPVSPLIVRFENGQIFAQGQTPLRSLFHGPPFAQLLPYLPDSRLDRQVWVTVQARITVEAASGGASQYASVDVTRFELGRQLLSSFLLYAAMGPSGGGLFRWPIPGVVEKIQIGEGNLTITTR